MTEPQPNERDRDMAHQLYILRSCMPRYEVVAEIAEQLMKARVEGRREAIECCLDILHEEGWLGRSEQRIRALAGSVGKESSPVEEQPQ